MQEPEQVTALVIGHLNSLAFPSMPHRIKKILRNGAISREAQICMKRRLKI